MRLLVLRYSVTVFIALTLGLSFAAYLLPIPLEEKALLFPMIVVFIPTLVATALAAIGAGRAGLGALYGHLRPGKPRWLLIGLLVGAALQLAFAVLALMLGFVPSIAINAAPLLLVVALLSPLFALAEEIGWRGFVLPRLLASHNRLSASLILGVPWALVHVTLFLPGMMFAGRPLLAQVVPVAFFSIVLTWVFVNSGGSVLAPTLLHGAFNGLGAMLNSGLTAEQATYLSAAALVATAVVLVVAKPSYWLRTEREGTAKGRPLPEVPG
ncbi:MAG: CPBP family intramembrane glutamic endopeptidase [Chloroflexota bacterium]